MRSEDWQKKNGLPLVIAMLFLLPAIHFIFGETGGDAELPTGHNVRASGLDISVVSFLSHNNGSTYPEGFQSVMVLLKNSGNTTFNDTLYVTFTVSPRDDEQNTTYTEISMAPAGSLLSPGNQTTVSFTGWNATPGWYILNTTISISDDNLTNNSLSIVVHIVAKFNMQLEISILGPKQQILPPGRSTMDPGFVPFSFLIKNRAETSVNVTYTITSSHNWLIPGNPIQGRISDIPPLGESSPVYFNVKVPADALTSSLDRINITVVREDNSSIRADDYVLVFTQEVYSVEVVAPATRDGVPGGPPIVYIFRVKNTGNVPDRYHLTLFNQSWWPARLLDGEYTSTVSPGEEVRVRALIRIPQLIYDRRIEMKTYYGAVGLLTLRAESMSSGVQNSAIAYTRVSLVYTVEVAIHPRRVYVDPLNTTQRILFNLSVRGIDNRENPVSSPYVTVNLSIPDGPHFYPAWMSGWNLTESKRYSAGLSAESLILKGGVWDDSVNLLVQVPVRPFHGICKINVTATTTGDGDDFGVELPSYGVAVVQINQSWGVKVEPEILNVEDENGNGIPDGQEATPGEYLEVFFNVTNIGNGLDYFRLEAFGESNSSLRWEVRINGSAATEYLTPKGFYPTDTRYFYTVSILVKPPLGVRVGEYIDVKLTAWSGENPLVRNTSTIRVYVKEGFGLRIEPDEIEVMLEPGERRYLNFTVTNLGNVRDSFIFGVEGRIPKGWSVELKVNYLDLPPGGGSSIVLSITCPKEAMANVQYLFTLLGYSVSDPQVNASSTIRVTVKEILDLELYPLGETVGMIYPGSTTTFTFMLTNRGNYNETFELSVVGIPSNWSATVSVNGGSRVELSPGKGAIIYVNVTAPGIELASSKKDLERLNIVAGRNITITLKVVSTTKVRKTLSQNFYCVVEQIYRARAVGPYFTLELFPGREREAKVKVVNLGNGPDRITLIFNGNDRYTRWIRAEEDAMIIDPFDENTVSVYVKPRLMDVPRYREMFTVDVVPLTSNNLPQTPGTITGVVLPYYYNTSSSDVDLGKSRGITLELMNLPTTGQDLTFGADLPRIVRIDLGNTSNIPGWNVSLSTKTVGFNTVLEKRTVEVFVSAPRELLYYPGTATVFLQMTSSDSVYNERVFMTFRAVYIDLFILPSDVHVHKSVGGDEAVITFRVRGEGLKSSGLFSVVVYLDGKKSTTVVIPSLSPAGSVVSVSEDVRIPLPEVKWYVGKEEHTLLFIIDPENRVYEANPRNFELGELNNKAGVNFEAVYPSFSLKVGGTILLITFLGFLGILYIIYRFGLTHPLFHVLLGLSVASMLGTLLTLPVSKYEFIGVNFTEILAAASLLGAFPFMIWIALGYHRYYIGWKLFRLHRKEEPDKSDEDILDTLSLDHLEERRWLLFSLVSAVSILMTLVYLFMAASPAIAKRGWASLNSLFKTPIMGLIPTYTLPILFLLFGVVLLYAILWKKEKMLEEIVDIRKRMLKMKQEIEEEFEPYRGL